MKTSIVVCPACRQKNRLDLARPPGARCGKCGIPLAVTTTKTIVEKFVVAAEEAARDANADLMERLTKAFRGGVN